MKQLYILCASILPLMICSGMVYSVFSLYIADDLGATKTQIGLIYMTGSATGAVFAPMLGKLSDKFGRRPLMILSMLGFAVAFASYSIIWTSVQAIPVQALEGITWAGMGVTVTAYIADIVPEDKRGWAMGVYNRTWSIGWIIGPVLGGYLAETSGFRITLLLGASIVIAGSIIMLTYVKESRK